MMLGGIDTKDLCAAIEASRERMKPFRENRKSVWKELVGSHYSEDGSLVDVPVNLIELGYSIYTAHLAAKNPRALVATPYRQLAIPAYNLELALNHLIEHEIGLVTTLQRAVGDALIGIGCIKVGLNAKGPIEIDGQLHDPGQPFADRVDLDDLVIDMNADSLEAVDFIGNRYRVPYTWAIESKVYQIDENEIRPSDGALDFMHNEGGDTRIGEIGRGHQGRGDSQVRDYLELWDIWLPKEKLVVTFATVGNTIKPEPVRIVRWTGPERGPFHILGFTEVPGSPYPLAPAAQWYDIHMAANRAMRKMIDGADRLKTLGVVGPGGDQDANRVVQASDGDVIRSDVPGSVQELVTGGVNAGLYQFFLGLRDIFPYMAGNLDLLGGLSPQSETASQDRLLAANASQRMQYMQSRVESFTGRIVRDLAWYLFYDPFISIPLTKRVPGTDVSVPFVYSAQSAEGDFLDYNFSIATFSMQPDTPATKLMAIKDYVTGVALPALPILSQQGGMIDWQALQAAYSQYTNTPEINDIVVWSDPSFADQAGPVRPGPESSSALLGPSKRTYEYKRTPGQITRHGRDFVQSQMAAGRGVQGAELSAMNRGGMGIR